MQQPDYDDDVSIGEFLFLMLLSMVLSFGAVFVVVLLAMKLSEVVYR